MSAGALHAARQDTVFQLSSSGQVSARDRFAFRTDGGLGAGAPTFDVHLDGLANEVQQRSVSVQVPETEQLHLEQLSLSWRAPCSSLSISPNAGRDPLAGIIERFKNEPVKVLVSTGQQDTTTLEGVLVGQTDRELILRTNQSKSLERRWDRDEDVTVLEAARIISITLVARGPLDQHQLSYLKAAILRLCVNGDPKHVLTAPPVVLTYAMDPGSITYGVQHKFRLAESGFQASLASLVTIYNETLCSFPRSKFRITERLIDQQRPPQPPPQVPQARHESYRRAKSRVRSFAVDSGGEAEIVAAASAAAAQAPSEGGNAGGAASDLSTDVTLRGELSLEADNSVTVYQANTAQMNITLVNVCRNYQAPDPPMPGQRSEGENPQRYLVWKKQTSTDTQFMLSGLSTIHWGESPLPVADDVPFNGWQSGSHYKLQFGSNSKLTVKRVLENRSASADGVFGIDLVRLEVRNRAAVPMLLKLEETFAAVPSEAVIPAMALVRNYEIVVPDDSRQDGYPGELWEHYSPGNSSSTGPRNLNRKAWTNYSEWFSRSQPKAQDVYRIERATSAHMQAHDDDLQTSWDPLPAPERPQQRDMWLLVPAGQPNQLLTKPGLLVAYYRVKYVKNSMAYAPVAEALGQIKTPSPKPATAASPKLPTANSPTWTAV